MRPWQQSPCTGPRRRPLSLDSFSSSANPLWLREKASFWLGAERGHDGYLALKKLASDPDPEFRKKLSFDLFVSHDPAAVDDLIHMAKSDQEVSVREQAIFWVGQKAGAEGRGDAQRIQCRTILRWQ